MNSPVESVIKNQLSTGGSIKLNLGGRDRHMEGYLTVDLEGGELTDIQTDVSMMDMFDSKSVDEIYASHVLEHFPHLQTQRVLKEWYRVLKPSAKAYIAVPDFDAAIRVYKQYGFSKFIRNLLWGDQEYPLAFHYTGFNYPFLAGELIEAGFNDVKHLEQFPHKVDDCSALACNLDFKSISLNVEATA